MKVKIAKWGNSLAVRLPKAVAEELDLTAGKTVEIERRGDRLTIAAAPPRVPRYTLEELLAQIEPGAEPPLEDWSSVEVPWPDDDWSDVAPSDEDLGPGDGGDERRS